MTTAKRPRRGYGGAADLKRASEIVMVLSALGEMRGGRNPTAAERALVAEARELLVGMCEQVKPKDLFSRDAVKVVVEDLGLDPGFQSPKISIPDKLLLTKKKMEEFEERLRFDVPSTRPSYLTQVGGPRAEHALSKGSSTSALGLESSTFQSSNQLTISHDMQTSVVQTTPENVLIGHPSSRGLTYVHADSDITVHNDIAKKVEMFLQQKVSDDSICTLPSIDFMNKPLSCQVCMIIINDGESILVCDTCEKGTHLKCLQPFDNGITSKTVWHCPNCVKASNGKSFPPKYGPVIRFSGTSKASLNRLVYPVKRAEHLVAMANKKLVSNEKSASLYASNMISTVDWGDDILEVIGEKVFYLSCRINGISHKREDHVLVSFNSRKLFPSKLQSLWEDKKAGSKWATVDPYYLPCDLPEAVKRPSTPEKSEVYASSGKRITVLAGSIHGPCEVLTLDKFREESDTSQLGDTNRGLRPTFMCRTRQSWARRDNYWRYEGRAGRHCGLSGCWGRDWRGRREDGYMMNRRVSFNLSPINLLFLFWTSTSKSHYQLLIFGYLLKL